MKKIVFILFTVLIIPTMSFSQESQGQEFIFAGIFYGNVKDYYPHATPLSITNRFEASTANVFRINKYHNGSYPQWILDQFNSVNKNIETVSKQYCIDRVKNEKQVFYGASNFDFDVVQTEDSSTIYFKYDMFCSK